MVKVSKYTTKRLLYHMKILFTSIVVLALIGAFWYMLGTPSGNSSVIFPNKGDDLVVGNTYTIRWNKQGEEAIQLFLINTALLGEGASVSISDRIYNVPDSGTYEYMISEALPPGDYKFQIGTLESETFHIVAN